MMTVNESIPNLVNICVDVIEEGDIKGRYYHKYSRSAHVFENVMDLVLEMEKLFDALDYPQATTRLRSFSKNKEQKKTVEKMESVWENAVFSEERGEKATFLVSVKTRANAGWQGEVIWVEKKNTGKFRSLLELIKMLDGAQQQDEAGISDSLEIEER